MKIHIHIDRLVLTGLPVEGNAATYIQAAVEQELGRLFQRTSQACMSQDLSRPYLATSPIQIQQQTSSETLGNQIAGALHEGLDQ